MKKLTALNDTENRFDHSGTNVLSKRVPISELQFSEDFQTLLAIKPETLQMIKDSMQKQGYDEGKPVCIWKEKGIVIDGHTRIAAARELGFFDIPVYEKSFPDIKSAMEYAASVQFARRVLSDSEILIFIEKLGIYGLTAEEISKALDVSKRKIERTRSVLNNATEEQIDQIKSGEKTINSVHDDVRMQKKSSKEPPDGGIENANEDFSEALQAPPSGGVDEEDEELSDSLSESEGNPQGLNFSHSDGIERPEREPWAEDEFDRRLIERYKEGKKDGYADGFSKGAYAVYEKIFDLLDEGRSADEVRNDPLFEDFSPTVIAGKFDEENLYDE